MARLADLDPFGVARGLCDRKMSPRPIALRTLINRALQHMSSTEQARWFVLGAITSSCWMNGGRSPGPQGPATLPVHLHSAHFGVFR